MSDESSSRLAVARDLALQAGRHTLKYFRQVDLRVDLKKDATPVTIADREAEQLIRQGVAAEFPQDGVLGEEFGEQQGTSGWRWIIDPIDGTKSFIHGVPLYAVLIGVELHEQSQIGVVHLPALDETVYAVVGQGAWHVHGKETPRPARVSQKRTLSEGLFVTSSLSGFHRRGAARFLERLTKAAKLARTWGDAYGYALLATGRADAMVDPALNLWDVAAIFPIIQEAGGRFTDWKGQATIHSGEGIATNGLVHDEVLGLLKE